jgi:hypothetical protein
MAASYLDERLYRWISIANESAERFDFPPGLIEESIQSLKTHLGEAFLTDIFKGTQSLHILGLRGQVLDRWLRGGASVDDHVIQVLDLVSVLAEFKDDPCLGDKLDRLKRNAFWPSQFELAMAQRAKRTIGGAGSVRLSCETKTAVGDFIIELKEGSIACECARLEFGDEEEEQYKLVGDLYQYLDHRLKRTERRCCVKIRIHAPLNPSTFGAAVQCTKTAFSRFNYKGEEASEERQDAKVTIEPLTEQSERIPFRYVNGRVEDVLGTKWVSAQSLCRVNAATDEEATDMYRAGADLGGDEYARVFIAWERRPADLDPYARIRSKIKKKKYQTKAGAGLLGRAIFLESQWNLTLVDADRLGKIVDNEMSNSKNTIVVVIGERCASVHYRPWYRYFISNLGSTFASNKVIHDFLFRLSTYDRDFDPILNQRYRRTWKESAERVRKHEAEWEEKNRRRERDL